MVDIFIYIYIYVVIFSLCHLVHKVKSLPVLFGCGLLVGKQEGEELMQDQQSDVKEWLSGCHGSGTGSVLLSLDR